MRVSEGCRLSLQTLHYWGCPGSTLFVSLLPSQFFLFHLLLHCSFLTACLNPFKSLMSVSWSSISLSFSLDISTLQSSVLASFHSL